MCNPHINSSITMNSRRRRTKHFIGMYVYVWTCFSYWLWKSGVANYVICFDIWHCECQVITLCKHKYSYVVCTGLYFHNVGIQLKPTKPTSKIYFKRNFVGYSFLYFILYKFIKKVIIFIWEWIRMKISSINYHRNYSPILDGLTENSSYLLNSSWIWPSHYIDFFVDNITFLYFIIDCS